MPSQGWGQRGEPWELLQPWWARIGGGTGEGPDACIVSGIDLKGPSFAQLGFPLPPGPRRALLESLHPIFKEAQRPHAH